MARYEVRYGGAVFFRYDTMVRCMGTVILVFRCGLYTSWWCGALEVGHDGLVRRRSKVTLGARQAGIGVVVVIFGGSVA